jgi:K+-sensing histidine kinase KdpD
MIARSNRGPHFPVFTAAVVVASVIGGTIPGLVAVAEGALINVLATPPLLSLRIASWDDAVRIAVFVLVGGGIAFLIGSLGELQQRLDKERIEFEMQSAD